MTPIDRNRSAFAPGASPVRPTALNPLNPLDLAKAALEGIKDLPRDLQMGLDVFQATNCPG
jgi:hypothetical protein